MVAKFQAISGHTSDSHVVKEGFKKGRTTFLVCYFIYSTVYAKATL